MVNEALEHVRDSLEAKGLRTHEVQRAALQGEVLGMELDGEGLRARVGSKKFWKLEALLRWCLRVSSVSGRDLEIVLGHCTYSALLSRSSLAVFCNAYKYVRAHYAVPHQLWPSVKAELACFLGLLPLRAGPEWRAAPNNG